MKRALAFALAFVCAGAAARADQVEPMQQSLLFLRVLAYDRNLKSRVAGEELTLAVVRRAGHADSEAAAHEIGAALAEIAKKSKVSGLGLRLVYVDYRDAGSFETKLRQTGAVALYVAPGLGEQVPAIAQAARRRQAVTGTGTEGFVRAGLSIGVVERDGRPALLINLPASRAEGADLDAAVLRLAEVIR